MMKRFFFIFAFFLPAFAHSAGYQNPALSASDLGTAFAGAGSAIENASAQAFNPASLSRLKGLQLSLGFAGVGENLKFQSQQNSYNGGVWRTLPNLYFSYEAHSKIVLGLGVNTPFSWKNRYDSPWEGEDWLLASQLQIQNITPSFALRAHEKWSVGAGLVFSNLKWKWQNTRLSTTQKENAMGFQLGVLLTPSDSMNVSLSYQSPLRFKGNNWEIETPQRFAISTWQQLNARWELMGSVAWSKWKHHSPLLEDISAQPIFSKGNGLRIAWGTAYLLNSAWKAKLGVAYDKTPLKENARTPLLPYANQWWFSAGVHWNYADWMALDLAYSYVYAQKKAAHLPRLGLSGRYQSDAHWWGLQYSVYF